MVSFAQRTKQAKIAEPWRNVSNPAQHPVVHLEHPVLHNLELRASFTASVFVLPNNALADELESKHATVEETRHMPTLDNGSACKPPSEFD